MATFCFASRKMYDRDACGIILHSAGMMASGCVALALPVRPVFVQFFQVRLGFYEMDWTKTGWNKMNWTKSRSTTTRLRICSKMVLITAGNVCRAKRCRKCLNICISMQGMQDTKEKQHFVQRLGRVTIDMIVPLDCVVKQKNIIKQHKQTKEHH